MKRIQILFLLIITAFSIEAQSDIWYHYKWKEVSKLDDKLVDEAQKFYEARNKDKIEVGDLLKRQSAYQASLFYTDYSLGLYYPGFNNYEVYIKQLFDKVIRDTTLSGKLRFYFSYNSDYNVEIDQLGIVKVNIGIFNYVQTEAELAAIISHAYGHFFNNEDVYIDQEKTIGQPTYLTQKWTAQLFNFYGDQELERLKKMESAADYIGMKCFKSSPYDLKGLAGVLKTLKRFEIKNELLFGNNKGVAKYHTDPGNRLKLAKSFSTDSSNIFRNRFVVDSLTFFELKKKAKQESYNYMMETHKYQDVLELSFTDYLYEPNDQGNLALLIESLRRYLLLNPTSETKQFIIENYKGKGSEKSNNYNYVYEDNTSILKYLNKGLLHLKSNDLSQLKAKDLLDTNQIKFKTNKEAFIYFVQRAKDIECKPCVFSSVFENPSDPKVIDLPNSQNTVFYAEAFFEDLRTKQQFSDNLYILNMPIIDKLDYFAVNTRTLYAKFLQDYKTKFKNLSGLENVQLLSDLSYDDQHKLNSINILSEKIDEDNLYFRAIIANIESQQKMTTGGANGVPIVYNRPNPVGKTSYNHKATLNCRAISPEAVEMYGKYKVKNIYFIDFDIIVINPTNVFMHYFSGDIKTRAWKFKKIKLDGSNDVIYEQNIQITKDPNERSLNDCVERFKAFVQYNSN